MIPDEIKAVINNFYTTKIQPNFWLIAIVFILVFIAYGSVIFLGKNNKIELEIEAVIEQETGVKVDLTP